MTLIHTGHSASGSEAGRSTLNTRFLVLFFALAFALSWAMWAIPVAPTYGPFLAAIIVVATTAGRHGLRRLLSQLGRWRAGLRWWLVAVSPGLLLLLTLAGLWLAGADLPAAADYSRSDATPALAIAGFLLVTFAASLGEEVGWRGYALPHLQRRFSPLAATLILAPMWWLWHLEFFVVDSLPLVAFPGFLVEVTGIAIVLTWLYNRTGGSIMLVVVWHAMYNFATVPGVAAVLIPLLVIVLGVVLVILDLGARRRGRSVLGPVREPTGAALSR
jgi:membrane protease YdiL (CAAX protease family)